MPSTTPAWHIVTGEYPPTPGGVSDYTHTISAGLAAAGDEVHVWCPGGAVERPSSSRVHVHHVGRHWRREDLQAVDAELSALPSPRRLLVQWVPHAYGRRSLNLGFCRWVHRRSRAGDVVDLMVHEPFLAFGEGQLRHNAAAAVHRLMVALLLRAARRVWVAIPAWSDCLRPWATRGRLDCCWLPVPSNVPVVDDPSGVAAARSAVGGKQSVLVGTFSTYGPHVRDGLHVIVPKLLAACPDARILLLGRGGEEVAAGFSRSLSDGRAQRITATGELDAPALSRHLQACDLMVQSYADGASTRRGTLMAALAHGLPVVTTTGRLSESFWAESSAVTTVSAQDPDQLVKAALALAADPARRRQQGALARELYESRFDVRHTLRALRDDACVPV